ncbi:MAG: oxidoreductase [Actinobacteria bacterium]|jgi:pyridoxine 4-dehydrogenase|nr:oxidoreductase [Actinomycetota bacterium]
MSVDGAGTVAIGDLKVNRLGFGAMRVTGAGIWGPPADPDEAKRVLRRVIELGINFIDTADSYGPDVSEELIGETLHPYPDDLVVGTKGGLLRPGPRVWNPDGRPEHLREALEGSLAKLKVDRIDLYQFHRPDPQVPYEESIGALKELQDEGKIRHIGISNVSTEQLEKARSIAEIRSVQNRFSIEDQSSASVLDACEAAGIAFLPWAPVSGGSLAGAGSALKEVAAEHDATPSQVALAWLLHRSKVMLPIPGTSKVAHLEENAKAASLELTEDDRKKIEAAI